MAGSIFLGFAAPAGPAAGPGGINGVVADAVRERFPLAADPARADLQIHSLSWNAPAPPRRVFIDHGSFADASFWAYVAPALTESDAIVVASSVCRQVARAMIASDGPRIHCVPFGVDTIRFRPPDHRNLARDAVSRRLGIPDDGPWFLVVGGFTARKNHHLAVSFLQAIHGTHPDARLLMAGAAAARHSSAAYRQAVADQARDASVPDRVHFLGGLPHEAIRDLMQASDLLLHLSTCRMENFGLVVAEALACGLPVLAADWGGFRDLVRHGENGFLARTWLSSRGPRVDWMALVTPARRLLEDPSFAKRMSRAARASAHPRLSLRAFRRRIVGALQSILEDQSRDPRPLRLTAAAEELRFRTLHLHGTRTDLRGTSDEYRLLVPLDGGRHYRLLSGAVASAVEPPRITPADRLYPAVTWRETRKGITVTDPAWPGDLELSEPGLRLLRRCDGGTTVGELAPDAPDGGPLERALLEAQRLVDEGMLAPAL